MADDFTSFVDERAIYIQFSLLQKLKPLSLGAEQCLLLLIRLLLLSIKGPGHGAPIMGSFSGFHVKKSVMGL